MTLMGGAEWAGRCRPAVYLGVGEFKMDERSDMAGLLGVSPGVRRPAGGLGEDVEVGALRSLTFGGSPVALSDGAA